MFTDQERDDSKREYVSPLVLEYGAVIELTGT
jgi:hypothetical protein